MTVRSGLRVTMSTRPAVEDATLGALVLFSPVPVQFGSQEMPSLVLRLKSTRSPVVRMKAYMSPSVRTPETPTGETLVPAGTVGAVAEVLIRPTTSLPPPLDVVK